MSTLSKRFIIIPFPIKVIAKMLLLSFILLPSLLFFVSDEDTNFGLSGVIVFGFSRRLGRGQAAVRNSLPDDESSCQDQTHIEAGPSSTPSVRQSAVVYPVCAIPTGPATRCSEDGATSSAAATTSSVHREEEPALEETKQQLEEQSTRNNDDDTKQSEDNRTCSVLRLPIGESQGRSGIGSNSPEPSIPTCVEVSEDDMSPRTTYRAHPLTISKHALHIHQHPELHLAVAREVKFPELQLGPDGVPLAHQGVLPVDRRQLTALTGSRYEENTTPSTARSRPRNVWSMPYTPCWWCLECAKANYAHNERRQRLPPPGRRKRAQSMAKKSCVCLCAVIFVLCVTAFIVFVVIVGAKGCNEVGTC